MHLLQQEALEEEDLEQEVVLQALPHKMVLFQEEEGSILPEVALVLEMDLASHQWAWNHQEEDGVHLDGMGPKEWMTQS